MSNNIVVGGNSRKVMVIAAAALTVAVLLAVSIFAAADSYADFAEDEAGYCIKATDPTDDDLVSLGWINRGDLMMTGIGDGVYLFDLSAFGTSLATADSFEALYAEGENVRSDSETSFSVYEITAKNVKIVYTATSTGTLLKGDISNSDDKIKAACDAIKAYLGDEVSAGDTLTISGKIKTRQAYEETDPYRMLDEGKCIRTGYKMTGYIVEDTDVTITLNHAGEEKSIGYSSNIKEVITSEFKNEYADSEIKIGTEYVVKNTVSYTIKGDKCLTVKGKDYSLIIDPETSPDDQYIVTEFRNQSSIVVSSYLKTEIAELPASSDRVKVEKTYDSAQSAFDDVMMDAVGKDVLKLLLIIGGVILGVIVLIIILVIVFLHSRKKKRQTKSAQ